MGVLDIAGIKAQREEELRLAQECAAWCAQAASEFAAAAHAVGTPLQGVNADVNPLWPVTRAEGRDRKWAEAWTVVRCTSSDNSAVNLLYSAVVAPNGTMYHNNKRVDAQGLGWHVASVAGYDLSVAQDIFREALLGRPVSE